MVERFRKNQRWTGVQNVLRKLDLLQGMRGHGPRGCICLSHRSEAAYIAATIAVLLVGYVASAHAAQDEQDILRLESATSAVDLAVAQQKAFSGASDQDVERLLQHSNSRVALAAAWERVRRTMPDPKAVRGAKPSHEALQRFVGFLEGRLQVNVPAAWEQRLMTATTNGQRHIRFDSGFGERPADQGVNVAVTEIDEGWRIESSGQAWLLDREDVEEVRIGGVEGSAAVVTKEAVLVGLFDDIAFPFVIFCIDPKTGAIKWTREVWVSALGGARGAGFWHAVQIVATDDGGFAVFGSGNHTSYVEVFTRDGDELCRFSTFNSTFGSN